ncbi:hypothetical protein AZZ92_004091, partial [Escherichia coli]
MKKMKNFDHVASIKHNKYLQYQTHQISYSHQDQNNL